GAEELALAARQAALAVQSMELVDQARAQLHQLIARRGQRVDLRCPLVFQSRLRQQVFAQKQGQGARIVAVGLLDALANDLELVRVDDDYPGDPGLDLSDEPARVASGFDRKAVAAP